MSTLSEFTNVKFKAVAFISKNTYEHIFAGVQQTKLELFDNNWKLKTSIKE